MATITLITGGCRSGKSIFAQQRALSYDGERIFIATATPFDEEMQLRIQKHKEERGSAFTTIEAPYNLPEVLISQTTQPSIILIDCLTVWCGNLMYQFDNKSDKIEKACSALLHSLQHYNGDVIVVTNEVGMGIVPDNAMARQFRDIAGTLNRQIAIMANHVFLLVCGIPVSIK